MILLNAIILPFQAGYENIIIASVKPKELFVIKRLFKDNLYKYNPQSDSSLFFWQGRVSMFIKGVALCLPFIGHITGVALRYFSFSIFPEMPLDFAIKCSPKQKLAIAKHVYTDKPEAAGDTTRIELANILADDEEGLNFLVANIQYLDFTTDIELFQRIIQKKPEVLSQILLDKCSPKQKLAIAKHVYTDKPEAAGDTTRIELANTLADDEEGLNFLVANIQYLDWTTDIELSQRIIQQKPEVLEQNKSYFAKQILQRDPTDCKFITNFFDPLHLNEDLAKTFIKELILQTKEAKLSHQMQAAIIHVLKEHAGNSFIEQLLKDKDSNIALADILLSSEEDSNFVVANISHINLFQNMAFSQKLFQKNPIPEQIKQHLAKQILREDPTDHKFIIGLFNSLEFNIAAQQEVIRELLRQMGSSSDQMQVAIAHTIIEKHPRGSSFLSANLYLFNSLIRKKLVGAAS